jgi:Cytosol aminopeptidase family, N-terminal domain
MKRPAAKQTEEAGPPVSLGMVSVDLQQWDARAGGDLLGVFMWTDVRPLRGAAGLLDWRLSGKLSSLIQSGRLTGAEGEQLLLPTGGRLSWKVAMVMGLGPRSGFSVARYRAAVRRSLTTVRGLAVHDIALAPPGRDVDAVPPRRAVELLLSEIRREPHADWLRRLTIVEAQGRHKELDELIAQAPRGDPGTR